jgi:FtsP/CotA-like multicopper oxidase with cupredoxin domain
VPPEKCGVHTPDGFVDDQPSLHKGFCQRRDDSKSAWLFTLNGQRFPTITVKGGSNVLLRVANVSANVSYWLELRKCDAGNGSCDGTTKNLTILSVDGVVPARPSLGAPSEPAFEIPNLLLMAASRAEIFISNSEAHPDEQEFVLWTKGPDMGTDRWPQIQLARIVLQRNEIDKTMVLALNAPVEQKGPPRMPGPADFQEREMPPGCVRDLGPGEHRRVTFFDIFGAKPEKYTVATELVHFPSTPSSEIECKENECAREDEFQPEPKETVGVVENDQLIDGYPFEDYDLGEGKIDWDKRKHVCIELRPGGSSHMQLWVLRNETGAVHNFHIHQMKFRLATKGELVARKILPPKKSHTCADPIPSDPCNSVKDCDHPGYKFYEDGCDMIDPKTTPIWHETIPVPKGAPVFLIMSFDAEEQVGRFVFHCHILKHEDRGLMAPIEVWNPKSGAVER